MKAIGGGMVAEVLFWWRVEGGVSVWGGDW